MLHQCGSLALLVSVWLFLGSGGEHRLGQNTVDAAAAVQRDFVHLVNRLKKINEIHCCQSSKQHRTQMSSADDVGCKYIYIYIDCKADLVHGLPSQLEEWFSVIQLQMEYLWPSLHPLPAPLF